MKAAYFLDVRVATPAVVTNVATLRKLRQYTVDFARESTRFHAVMSL